VARELSEYEEKYLRCEACTKKVTTARGLRVHKGIVKCWDKPVDMEALNKTDDIYVLPTFKEETIIPNEVTETIIPNEVASVKPPAPEPPPVDITPPPAPKPVEPPLKEMEEAEIATIQAKYINPTLMGIKEIPVGSKILLKGTLFSRDSDSPTGFTQEKLVEGIPGLVQSRWLDDKSEKWLDVKAEGSDKVFICKNASVCPPGALDPTIKIMRLGLPKKEDVVPDKDFLRTQEFSTAVTRYATARDAQSNAKEEYKKVDKENRPTLIKYATDFGVPSKEGGKDNAIIEAGYRVLWSYLEQKDRVTRDDEAIIEYAKKNGYLDLIKYVPKVEDDVYLTMKENGVIPKELVEAWEETTPVPPKRLLYVDKVDE